MNIGLKTYPKDLEKVKSLSDLFKYVEVLISPDFNIQKLLDYSFPINVHVAHEKFGYNPADLRQKKLNELIIQKTLEAADLVDSEYIVVHPGYSVDKEDVKNSFDFFDDFFDKRMLMENCPVGALQSHFFFSTPKEIKEFTRRYNSSFLFDVGHALLSANVLKENIFNFIKDFEEMNPKAHHVYGTDINSTMTEHHKHFHQVDSDYSYLSLLNPKSMFILETDFVERSTREDYEKNIAFLKSHVSEEKFIKE